MSRYQKHHREIMREAQRIAEAYRGEIEYVDAPHGHPKLVCRRGNVERITPLANSPKNRDDAVRRKACDVRRIFRELAG